MVDSYPPESPEIAQSRAEMLHERYDNTVTTRVSHRLSVGDDKTDFAELMIERTDELINHPSGHCETAALVFDDTEHPSYRYAHCELHLALDPGAPTEWVHAQLRAMSVRDDAGPPEDPPGGGQP